MTTFLVRSAWTSTSAAGASLSGSKLRGVAVHWPGTTQEIIGDPGQDSIANRLRSYRNFHVTSNGWSDIGYNFAIDQAGRVWMLRSTGWHGNRVGAHCASDDNPDANHEYVGVLLILGLREQPSSAMLAAFRDWYRNRFLPVWTGRTDVRGHGKVPGAQTNCPGARALDAIASGALTSGSTEEEDVLTEAQAMQLQRTWEIVTQIINNHTKDDVAAEVWATAPIETLAGAIAARLSGGADVATIRAVVAEELAKLRLTTEPDPS